MNQEDQDIFKLVVDILNENKINFWLCHGTLLGIVRENRLLPWDHDIDFAIWDDEYTKDEIHDLFKDIDIFKLTFVPEEMSNLHYIAKEKRVDINFYSRNDSLAYIKWIDQGTILIRTLYFMSSYLYLKLTITTALKSSSSVAAFIKFMIIILLVPFKLFCTLNIKKRFYNYVLKKLTYTGYSYPIELMNTKQIKFLNISVPVSVNPEQTLEITYGKDWKTPKKDYVWYKEAKNLLKQ